jgi:hypothetical protein
VAVAVCLLAAVAVAGVGGHADPASALCLGSSPNFISGQSGGVYWGHEQSNGITCNGDGVYRGWVQDPLTDGYCVAMAFGNTSTGQWHYNQGASCDAGGYVYTFYGSRVSYFGTIYRQGAWWGDPNTCVSRPDICTFDLHFGF